MNADFLHHKRRGTKRRYLTKVDWTNSRSDHRGRMPRPASWADMDLSGWEIFELLVETADTKNPYAGVILSWEELQKDEVALAIWDDLIVMLCRGVPRSDLAEVAVLHNERPATGRLQRHTALHGNICNIHLPTGKKLYPFFLFRDEARVCAWRLKTNRKHGWADPGDEKRLRPWNGASKTPQQKLLEIMRFDAIPLLEQNLKDAGGKPVSVKDRCNLLTGCRSIVSAKPVCPRGEECILLKYRDGDKVRVHVARGTLFWHGDVRWVDGRIVAEHKSPRRPPWASAMAWVRQHNYLQKLTQEADEFSRQNVFPEIRPALVRIKRRIATIAPTNSVPEVPQAKKSEAPPELIVPKPFVSVSPETTARELREATSEINRHHEHTID